MNSAEIDKFKNISGVYIIRNAVNGKRYIGSSGNISKRIKRNLYDLANRKHISKSMQIDWDEHGRDAFDIEEVRQTRCRLKVEKEYQIRLRPEYCKFPGPPGISICLRLPFAVTEKIRATKDSLSTVAERSLARYFSMTPSMRYELLHENISGWNLHLRNSSGNNVSKSAATIVDKRHYKNPKYKGRKPLPASQRRVPCCIRVPVAAMTKIKTIEQLPTKVIEDALALSGYGE